MSGLTEEQKLVMLGLKNPSRQHSDGENISIELEGVFDDFEGFQDEFLDEFPDGDDGSFDDFEDWLASYDEIDDDLAQKIRNEYEDTFEEFETLHETIEDGGSFFDLEVNFERSVSLESEVTDEDGRSVAGIQVYESGGLGRDGQEIPEGGVEIYGQEVHFSQSTADVDDEDPGDEDGDTGTTYQFAYSDLEVSNTTPVPHETITISAQVTNDASRARAESVGLYVDGEEYASEYVSLTALDVTTVEFEWSHPDYDSFEIRIGPLAPETVTVIHPGLTL